ncbi:bactofilin family protein [Solitalea koreensis]|nr:polymer-forming cytoskeletal protein [Solitalea koreensis]
MNEGEESLGSSINLIGSKTEICGDLTCKGDVRIDGFVKGSIHSVSKVVLGSTGRVEGSISCVNADISGTLSGNINISELLFLKSTAKIDGDIYTAKMVVESGAVFTGKCHMGSMHKTDKKNEHTISAERKEAERISA